MRGCTYSYVDFAGIRAVGDLLLDARPALVFASDGARILWGNASALGLFGESRVGDLLQRRISDLNPLKAQIARLARILPTDAPRMEILRIGGVGLSTLAAACRRMNLEGDERALLVVAASPVAIPAPSLTARAEQLVDAASGGDCLAAVLAEDGKVIAAAGGFDDLLPAEPAIDLFIEQARQSSDRIRKSPVGRRGRPAGLARFEDRGRRLMLVIVGPPGETAEMPAGPDAIPMAETDPGILSVGEMPIEMMLPLFDNETEDDGDVTAEGPPPPVEPPAQGPRPPPAPVVQFVWETDAGARFTLVSDALAEAIGEGYRQLAGLTWREATGALGADADGTIANAFADGTPFTATTYWPDETRGDRVAIDIAGTPLRARDGTLTGIRGFGTIRADDRRPDDRAEKTTLTSLVAAAEEPVATTPETLALDPGPAEISRETVAPISPPDDADDAARISVEVGARPRGEPQSNIVRLPGAPVRILPERLSGTERDAFRRIAEMLGTRPPADEAPAEVAEETAPAAEPPKAPSDIDVRLLDRLPIGIAIFRDRKTLLANRPLLDLLGYDTIDAFQAAGGAEAIFPGRDRIADNLAEGGGRLSARRHDGGTIPVNAWLHAITFAGNTALMLSIEEQRSGGATDDEIAVALARSEARAEELAAILDTATDGVIVIDGRGKIGSMNHAAEALFGVESGEYAGRYFTDLLADESQKAALDYLDGLAQNGVASVLNDGREVIGRVPQGGLIPLFMTMGKIGGSDKFAAVLRDITHWKNVEEELTAAKRAAEAANQQKSDFLAKISHEIRTPLNAIIGFSEVMMSERFGQIGNARYRDYLRDIHVSGGHLMSLINDLLDLSKIEAGKLDLSFEAVPVNAIIQESVALMQPQANRERIIIRTSLSVDVPNVVADPRSFRQILLNLLSNAIKFTRAGGQVIVSTTLEASGEVVVRIRDTGVGMSAKDLDTAMKPFRQVATSRDDRADGTGLGLPLTKALVEANRATFAIESALNEGTLVKVTFPTTRVLAG